MKTRLDAPHLEKLRHDYQLLHDVYDGDDGEDSGFWTAMLIFGWVCLMTAVAAMAVTIGGL